MAIEIVPLSEENIKEANKLVNGIFPTDSPEGYRPSDAFESSLDPESHPNIFEDSGALPGFRYFVAVEDGKVIGTTGYYVKKAEPKNAWLGWFCVNPNTRGKGVGEKLLKYTIDVVRQKGFKKLRLYTSYDKSEAAAQPLYEKLGLKIYKEDEEYGEKAMFRELEL